MFPCIILLLYYMYCSLVHAVCFTSHAKPSGSARTIPDSKWVSFLKRLTELHLIEVKILKKFFQLSFRVLDYIIFFLICSLVHAIFTRHVDKRRVRDILRTRWYFLRITISKYPLWMPNILTNHAITYTNMDLQRKQIVQVHRHQGFRHILHASLNIRLTTNPRIS